MGRNKKVRGEGKSGMRNKKNDQLEDTDCIDLTVSIHTAASVTVKRNSPPSPDITDFKCKTRTESQKVVKIPKNPQRDTIRLRRPESELQDLETTSNVEQTTAQTQEPLTGCPQTTVTHNLKQFHPTDVQYNRKSFRPRETCSTENSTELQLSISVLGSASTCVTLANDYDVSKNAGNSDDVNLKLETEHLNTEPLEFSPSLNLKPELEEDLIVTKHERRYDEDICLEVICIEGASECLPSNQEIVSAMSFSSDFKNEPSFQHHQINTSSGKPVGDTMCTEAPSRISSQFVPVPKILTNFHTLKTLKHQDTRPSTENSYPVTNSLPMIDEAAVNADLDLLSSIQDGIRMLPRDQFSPCEDTEIPFRLPLNKSDTSASPPSSPPHPQLLQNEELFHFITDQISDLSTQSPLKLSEGLIFDQFLDVEIDGGVENDMNTLDSSANSSFLHDPHTSGEIPDSFSSTPFCRSQGDDFGLQLSPKENVTKLEPLCQHRGTKDLEGLVSSPVIPAIPVPSPTFQFPGTEEENVNLHKTDLDLFNQMDQFQEIQLRRSPEKTTVETRPYEPVAVSSLLAPSCSQLCLLSDKSNLISLAATDKCYGGNDIHNCKSYHQCDDNHKSMIELSELTQSVSFKSKLTDEDKVIIARDTYGQRTPDSTPEAVSSNHDIQSQTLQLQRPDSFLNCGDISNCSQKQSGQSECEFALKPEENKRSKVQTREKKKSSKGNVSNVQLCSVLRESSCSNGSKFLETHSANQVELVASASTSKKSESKSNINDTGYPKQRSECGKQNQAKNIVLTSAANVTNDCETLFLTPKEMADLRQIQDYGSATEFGILKNDIGSVSKGHLMKSSPGDSESIASSEDKHKYTSSTSKADNSYTSNIVYSHQPVQLPQSCLELKLELVEAVKDIVGIRNRIAFRKENPHAQLNNKHKDRKNQQVVTPSSSPFSKQSMYTREHKDYLYKTGRFVVDRQDVKMNMDEIPCWRIVETRAQVLLQKFQPCKIDGRDMHCVVDIFLSFTKMDGAFYHRFQPIIFYLVADSEKYKIGCYFNIRAGSVPYFGYFGLTDQFYEEFQSYLRLMARRALKDTVASNWASSEGSSIITDRLASIHEQNRFYKQFPKDIMACVRTYPGIVKRQLSPSKSDFQCDFCSRFKKKKKAGFQMVFSGDPYDPNTLMSKSVDHPRPSQPHYKICFLCGSMMKALHRLIHFPYNLFIAFRLQLKQLYTILKPTESYDAKSIFDFLTGDFHFNRMTFYEWQAIVSEGTCMLGKCTGYDFVSNNKSIQTSNQFRRKKGKTSSGSRRSSNSVMSGIADTSITVGHSSSIPSTVKLGVDSSKPKKALRPSLLQSEPATVTAVTSKISTSTKSICNVSQKSSLTRTEPEVCVTKCKVGRPKLPHKISSVTEPEVCITKRKVGRPKSIKICSENGISEKDCSGIDIRGKTSTMPDVVNASISMRCTKNISSGKDTPHQLVLSQDLEPCKSSQKVGHSKLAKTISDPKIKAAIESSSNTISIGSISDICSNIASANNSSGNSTYNWKDCSIKRQLNEEQDSVSIDIDRVPNSASEPMPSSSMTVTVRLERVITEFPSENNLRFVHQPKGQVQPVAGNESSANPSHQSIKKGSRAKTMFSKNNSVSQVGASADITSSKSQRGLGAVQSAKNVKVVLHRIKTDALPGEGKASVSEVLTATTAGCSSSSCRTNSTVRVVVKEPVIILTRVDEQKYQDRWTQRRKSENFSESNIPSGHNPVSASIPVPNPTCSKVAAEDKSIKTPMIILTRVDEDEHLKLKLGAHTNVATAMAVPKQPTPTPVPVPTSSFTIVGSVADAESENRVGNEAQEYNSDTTGPRSRVEWRRSSCRSIKKRIPFSPDRSNPKARSKRGVTEIIAAKQGVSTDLMK